MKNDTVYLIHIKEAVESIESYISGINYDGFISNKMMVDAVIRELEIIGEASNNLSKEFQQKYPQIMWRRIKNMRNFLIHEYFGVNTKVVWDACKNDVPEVKTFINSVMLNW